MPTTSSTQIERHLAEINWEELKKDRLYYPSPVNWEDEVLYFLFVDRFSDSKEYGGFSDVQGQPITGHTDQRSTPLFDAESDANQADRNIWFAAGRTRISGSVNPVGRMICSVINSLRSSSKAPGVAET